PPNNKAPGAESSATASQHIEVTAMAAITVASPIRSISCHERSHLSRERNRCFNKRPGRRSGELRFMEREHLQNIDVSWAMNRRWLRSADSHVRADWDSGRFRADKAVRAPVHGKRPRFENRALGP